MTPQTVGMRALGDPAEWSPNEAQQDALVSLVETQASQVSALREAVDNLAGRLALRAELDGVIAADLSAALAQIADRLADADDDPTAVGDARSLVAALQSGLGEVLAVSATSGSVVVRADQERVPLDDLARRVGGLTGGEIGSRVRVVAPPGAGVRTAPGRFVALVADLVVHAARADALGGPLVVDVELVGGQVTIEVADDDPVLALGDGVDLGAEGGLFLARRLARSLGGDICTRRVDGRCHVLAVLPQRRIDDLG